VVNHCKLSELVVASRQSALMTRLPRRSVLNLILMLNQETIHDFVLLILPPCGPHLTPRPLGPFNQAYLSAPHLETHSHGPFALVLHLHRHQSSSNLHLQYLAKSQSTPHCQSLITPESDHPPVLEPHRLSISPLMSALTTHTCLVTGEKEK
jgi:hypothetical protein